MNLTTFSSRLATGVVAAVAGFASYSHIVKVAKSVGEDSEVAYVLPLSIDGLIVVGTMAMLDDKRRDRQPRMSARVALGFGIVATLAANVASAQPSLKARLVAAVPALAFLIAVEVLARTGRIRAVEEPPAVHAEPDTDEPAAEPEPVDNLSTPKTPPAPVRKPHPSAKERVERAHRRTPDAPDGVIAKRLNLSPKTVNRHRPERPVEPAPVNGHDVLADASR